MAPSNFCTALHCLVLEGKERKSIEIPGKHFLIDLILHHMSWIFHYMSWYCVVSGVNLKPYYPCTWTIHFQTVVLLVLVIYFFEEEEALKQTKYLCSGLQSRNGGVRVGWALSSAESALPQHLTPREHMVKSSATCAAGYDDGIRV